MIRRGGDDLAFLGVSKQFELTHDPRNSLVVHWFMTCLVFEFGGDSFGPITTLFGGENRLDPGTEESVGYELFSTD
ncbi:hypothetical protein SB89_02040 [Corynebacterium glutamicum]|nr:hypothetical protein SB89_02040 [Corynebacterium glutamicum]TWS33447.1 hypothetical protein AKJ21_12160 [Corynebacterium glutamicum]